MNKIITLFFLTIFSLTVKAQNGGIALQFNAEYGFDNSSLHVNEYSVNTISAYGFSGLVNYFKPLSIKHLAINIGVGVRAYQLNAKTTLAELSGTVVQPIVITGLNYNWLNKHQTQIGLKVTSNEDLSDFINEMTDLLRYNYTVFYQYHFNEKITWMIGYEGIIYPNEDLYRIENPGHLLSCGIQYNFWK